MSKLPYWDRNRHRALEENHDKVLRQVLGLPSGDQLPERVLNEYWRIKEVYDLIGQQITMRDLALVVVLSGIDHKAPARMGMSSLVESGTIGKMSNIEVYMRGQWRKSKVLDSNPRDKTVRVLIDGDNVPRNVPEQVCRLPEPATLVEAKA